MPGLLHYFGVNPLSRHHLVSARPVSEKDYEYEISFYYRGKLFSIFSSKSCCHQYVKEGGRLWIVVTRHEALRLKKQTPFVLKGFFDGSFLNYNRFPTDASMYLFLWDPASPDEKGIDFLIE